MPGLSFPITKSVDFSTWDLYEADGTFGFFTSIVSFIGYYPAPGTPLSLFENLYCLKVNGCFFPLSFFKFWFLVLSGAYYWGSGF